MGKSVIIIDTPQRCIDCPFSDDDYIGLCCNVYTYKNISLNAAMAGKPDWCPLQKLPEPKSEEFGQTVINAAKAEGWNAFLNVITNKKEDKNGL